MFPYFAHPKEISVTPVISTSAYAAGNAIGSVLTLAGVSKRGGAWANLLKTVVTDKSHQDGAINVILLDTVPVSTVTDRSAFTLAAGDLNSVVAVYKIQTTDYSSYVTPGLAEVYPLQPLSVLTKASSALYAILVAEGSITWTSTSDLTFRFTFLQLS